MRVIAGKWRSLPLRAPEGMNTRPTTDRIKETLFNMIRDELYGCVFLDLFSGSGSIGIEAASRGAEKVFLVENDRKAVTCIRHNIAFTHAEQECHLLAMDVMSALKKLETTETFDVIFMDPPYERGLERQVLEFLAVSKSVNKDTMIIVEASLNTDFSYLEELGFKMKRYKKYKTNAHVFVGRKTEEEL